MNVTKGFRRVPQFEDAYRDLFKHEVHKFPNRQLVALFDSFDNVIGRPFDDMTEAHKKILVAQGGTIARQAQANTGNTPVIQHRIDTPEAMSVASTPRQPMDITAGGATPAGQGLTPSPFHINQEAISSAERAANEFDDVLQDAARHLPPAH